MVMATEKKTALVVDDAGGGEAMQCADHPYRTNAGGVCAFCLQEKLGKLVSSSKSSSPFSPLHPTLPSPSPPSSSSSSSFFPLDTSSATSTSTSRRSRIPSFLHRKKSKKTTTTKTSQTHNPTATFTRSKSVAGRKPLKTTSTATVSLGDSTPLDSPRKRWFWSFLHPHPHLHQTRSSSLGVGAPRDRERTRHPQSSKISGFPSADPSPHPIRTAEKNHVGANRCTQTCHETKRLVESYGANASPSARSCKDTKRDAAEEEAPAGKVGRSRSVGCGSRSFSGDFLERISTGLGDCTLRRVESQREGKTTAGSGGGRVVLRRMSVSGPTADGADDRSGQQRVRCAGIFGMAMAAAVPPCPAYWAVEEDGGSCRGTPRVRGKGWGWALASPIRALRSGARGHVEGSQESGEHKGSVTSGSSGGAPSSLVSVRG